MESKIDDEKKTVNAEEAPPTDESVDGQFSVSVSEDNMNVTLDVHPSKGRGRPLSFEAIKEKLASMGIAFGLDLDAIKSTVAEAEETKSQRTDVTIAQGTASEQGRDTVIHYHFSDDESILAEEKPSDESISDEQKK